MHILSGEEALVARAYLEQAAQLAQQATCTRSRCGSLIVAHDRVIGRGVNSPPREDASQRRCANNKASYHPKITDKTCCVHAEQRAIMDALRNGSATSLASDVAPQELIRSRLYFVRLDDQGKPPFAGQPYCTICSKMALDAGIAEFVLWHEEGITVYKTDEYNMLSYTFSG